MSKYKSKFSIKGFTLVELLVVVAILAVLMLVGLVAFNPLDQLNKAKDVQRKQDLGQIREALDTYYNDNHCYPQLVPFGLPWENEGVLYMKKVPQDPDCSKGYCYAYQTEATSSCPQWNILFSRLSKSPIQIEDRCINVVKNVCTGLRSFNAKYSTGYCVLSGNSNCVYLQSNIVQISPTPMPTTPTASPSPTIPGVDCQGQYFAVTAGLCNNLGSDPSNKCTIHGGELYCYSQGGGAQCGGVLCSQ